MFAPVLGFGLGLVHVVTGPDHLAAVAPLSVDARESAWRTGMRWGIGHSSGVALIGVLALALREVLPLDAISSWSERVIGLTLICIGAWGLIRAFGRRVEIGEHRHGELVHAHPHLHAKPRGSQHSHAALAVGTLHGLAGSSHLFGVLPALALPTRVDSALYLFGFALGTIVAMALFAQLVGSIGKKRVKPLLATTSFVALGVGIWWSSGLPTL